MASDNGNNPAFSDKAAIGSARRGGLTKREYMATQIAAGLITKFSSCIDASSENMPNMIFRFERRAITLAVEATDALLEELSK